jgi:hypothetical protein
MSPNEAAASAASAQDVPATLLLASTADRVWVRVNNQRTVVVMLGEALAGYGRLLAIQGRQARFEKGTLVERVP